MQALMIPLFTRWAATAYPNSDKSSGPLGRRAETDGAAGGAGDPPLFAIIDGATDNKEVPRLPYPSRTCYHSGSERIFPPPSRGLRRAIGKRTSGLAL